MNPDRVWTTEGAFRVDHPVLSKQDQPPGGFVPTELSEMYGPLPDVNDASGECPLGGQLTMITRTVECFAMRTPPSIHNYFTV